MNKDAYKKIYEYHQVTKHHFNRYAASAGSMDWENQPNPFRFYEKAPIVEMPLLESDLNIDHRGLYFCENNTQDFSLISLGGFLELSLGLSAWKSFQGSQWCLRMNPSSGNLHPTEAHLIVPQLKDMEAGVYHYNPFLHALEQRAELPGALSSDIEQFFNSKGFLISLTSIYWRQSWKYGERAFRYCNHDVGYALAAIRFSANLFGWKVNYLNSLSDLSLDSILGFNKLQWSKLDKEEPDLLCWVFPKDATNVNMGLSDSIIENLKNINFQGKPNKLSKSDYCWEIIYESSDCIKKPKVAAQDYIYEKAFDNSLFSSDIKAGQLIRKRRSAQAYISEKSFIALDVFLAILEKTLPYSDRASFDLGLNEICINLAIFVHRVRELEEGLYFFIRNKKHFQDLKASFKSDFLWEQVRDNLPLYRLKKSKVTQQAADISCMQDIAGDSAFSLGMIALFDPIIRDEPYKYKNLFWESGAIGQVLYLEAESHGLRGTGIGCYFDDVMHELLGLKSSKYQSLYHFTIGSPLEDERLTTLPPYFHLKDIRK